MKLWKAVLTSIVILPLAIISHAEDVNTQNLRISETSMMSVNETVQPTIQKKEKVPTDNKSSAINNSNDVEMDREEGFRWPWQGLREALKFRKDFKNQSRP